MDVFDYIKNGPKKATTIPRSKFSKQVTWHKNKSRSLAAQQIQIEQLRRAINKNAQELQTYRKQATTYTRSTTGVETTVDISLSELITADANFRENVLGDKFRMKYVFPSHDPLVRAPTEIDSPVSFGL